MPRKKKSTLLENSNENKNSTNGILPKFIDDPKYLIRPKNDEQKTFLETIDKNIITFADGRAGSGKTTLAVYYGLIGLLSGKFSTITLSRPNREACGDEVGTLPGDVSTRLSHLFTPIFDAFARVAPEEVMTQLYKKNGKPSPIKIIPIGHLRGHSFTSSYVVVDEAQNLSIDQSRLLVTRIGEGSKIVIVGDANQSDLYGENGLTNAFSLLQGIEGIGFVTLSEEAIVRHPIIKEIERRYQERKKKAIADKQKKLK